MKKLTFILSITLTLSAFTQVPSNVPTDGLVGWWPFNGNANDESGNGNHGTVIGEVPLTTDRNGNPNSAYSFLGSSSSYININQNASFSNFSDGFTLSAWSLSSTGSSTGRVLSLGNTDANGLGFHISFFPNMGIILQNGLGGSSNSYGNWSNAVSNLQINSWNHVVLTANFASGNWSVYHNGNLVLSGTSNSTTLLNFQSNTFNIGRKATSAFDPWNGKIDDIGIWNRALTPEEVTALYNGCEVAIVNHPQSQTVSDGDNVQFSVTSSDPNATFQWQTNIVTGFQNLSDAGQYSGVTTNTLSIANVSDQNNNQQFRCVVQSGSCVDTSQVALLQVCGNITTQPSNQLVPLNSSAQFSLTATGSQLSYQWQTNLGLGFQDLTDAGQYSGSNTNTLNVANVSLSNNNQQFRCVVSSSSCTDTTDIVLLNVDNNVGLNEQNQLQLLVYPNPASSIVTIKNPQNIPSHFIVIDAQGRKLHSGTLNKETQIDLHPFSSGMYTIIFDNKALKEVKLVKE